MRDIEYQRTNRLGLAEMLGLKVKLYREDGREWSVYDGKVLHISEGLKPIDLDHEIGHFLAATPKERRRIEWDLGMGPSFPPEPVIRKHNIKALIDTVEKAKEDAEQYLGPPIDYSWNKETSDKVFEYRGNKESQASIYGIAISYVWGAHNSWREHAAQHTWDSAETACDVLCLLRPTEHAHLEPKVKRLLTRLRKLMK